MLTPEQVKNMKDQLIKQIGASFPEDKRQFAISQIEAMDSEQLEEFLVKNRLLKKEGSSHAHSGQCVFCSIVLGDINSYKIAENSKAIAVLEINPVSRGHTIIIPKEHIASEKELPKQVSALSKKVSSVLKSRLKPREIKTELSNILGHEILNIVPVYDEKIGERHHATQEELLELQKTLTAPKKATIPKKPRKTKLKLRDYEKIWLPKRIP